MRVDKIARDRVNEFEPSFTKRMLIISSTNSQLFTTNLQVVENYDFQETQIIKRIIFHFATESCPNPTGSWNDYKSQQIITFKGIFSYNTN